MKNKMELKERSQDQKLRGGYYTPGEITAFIAKWAIEASTKKVLEPSCGDGNFIEAAIKRFHDVGILGDALVGRIKGIELIEQEASKAKLRAKLLGLNSTTIENSDFFQYLSRNDSEKFDAVIGNPPFIRYQNFPEEHRKLAIEQMIALGLTPNKLTNIWVPFLTVSASLLGEAGKLGMVIPAELFQVKYAAETRIFLSNFFERITIVTFKKLVFNDIQQEVVLLLCEKKVAGNKGIRMIECESLSELSGLDLTRLNGSGVKKIDHTSEKWTKYFLSTEEIGLLQKLKQDSRIISCGEIMKVSVGLVTGLNEFFMLDERKAKELKLANYTTPVVSKSNQLKGIVFSRKDFRTNSVDLDSTHLFLPPDKEFDKLSKACRDYIKYGESMNYHKGYKCRIRKRWYITPSLWTPDAFALRQAGDYPKIILNKSEASSTDTIHRVKFKTKIDRELVAVSFLNSLTFAFSEITGRSYGGGVMTFEPTEFEEIRIPSLVKLKVNIAEIDKLIRQRKIEKVLDIVDDALLIRGHGFKKEEVRVLRDIWKKLSSRRSARGQSRVATNGSADDGK